MQTTSDDGTSPRGDQDGDLDFYVSESVTQWQQDDGHTMQSNDNGMVFLLEFNRPGARTVIEQIRKLDS
jgi:hypothetical protein